MESKDKKDKDRKKPKLKTNFKKFGQPKSQRSETKGSTYKGKSEEFDRDDRGPTKAEGERRIDKNIKSSGSLGEEKDKPFRKINREGGESFDRSRPIEKKDRGFEKFDRDEGKSSDQKNKGYDRPSRNSGPSERKDRGFKSFDRGGRKPDFRDKKELGFKAKKERPFSERSNFRKFEKEGKHQVGLNRPPRYDMRNLHQKAPFRAKSRIQAEEDEGNKEIRLNRYLANAGLCSRREADELIASGMIKVNGKVVSEMGYKVLDSDTVTYGKNVLSRERMMYILLNKPKDFITTMDDPNDRKTVMDLVDDACKERIYPVGRLDRNTTGLLLLTNDGELTEKLTHPSSQVKKIYQAELNKPLEEEHFLALKEGIELEDGFIKPDQLAFVTPDAEVMGIEIHSGRNHIVRRMFEHFGYEVQKLDRTVFASLNKKDLPRGKWRFLTEKEVIMLKYLL